MLGNYFLIAWRNLKRHKVFSLVNVLGLAIGMAACLLIFLYVQDEMSFDQYHPQAELIYQVTTRFRTAGPDTRTAGSGIDVGPTLQRNYPEIKEAVRLKSLPTVTIRKGGQLFNETAAYRADANLFRVFSYPMLEGDAATALIKPKSLLLTEHLAKKYFGQDWEAARPVGQSLQLNDQPYVITGVLKDLPTNTDLKFTALLSFEVTPEEREDWLDPAYFTFLRFESRPKAEAFAKKLALFDRKQYEPRVRQLQGFDLKVEHEIQPLTKVHFAPGLYDDTPKGNRSYLLIFSLTAFFILLVAVINYVNLHVAQATQRQKEVGIRKVAGAGRTQLLAQFVGESVLLTAIGGLLTLTLVQLLSPAFNRFTEKNFTLHTIPDWPYVAGGLGTVLGIGLLAGSYPAFYLAAADPARVLKGQWVVVGRQGLKKGLVVVQFTISAALMMGTLVVYQQMHYLRNKNLGFEKEQLLVVEIPDDEAARQKIPALKTTLAHNSRIRKVSIGPKPVAFDGKASFSSEENGRTQDQFVNFVTIDENYLDLLRIKLVAGRNFSAARTSDPTQAVLVNEAFVRWMGWKNAIGQIIRPSHDASQQKRVIGVVKDFHYASLHNPIEPILLYYSTANLRTLLVGISPEDLAVVRSAWSALIPNRPFTYSFLDAEFDGQYRQEEKMMTLFTWFSALTLLIAGLGLFALASITMLQRTKEIGIRKVLGASTTNLFSLLSKDFIRLVLLANVIAWPLAWYVMSRWLESYAFRILISAWLFIWPTVLVLLIALLTVSIRTWQAVRQNPVEALRYE
ncbi:MAG: ABC transporter permease [Ferruginibacter sp.]|nr:ABC transporter permease [Cytophagales bacterium]